MKPPNKKSAPQNDRLPPHSMEAEAGFLSCVLQLGLEVLSQAEEAGLGREWFYDLRHQHVYAVAWEQAAQGKPIDVITVGNLLQSRQLLDQVGGYDFLSTLADLAPSAHNSPQYVEILREKWLARSLVKSCTSAVIELYGTVAPVDVLRRLETTTLLLAQSNQSEREIHIKEPILEVIEDLEDYHRGRAQMRGISTGLEYNDKLLCGIGGENGNYIVLSARPGMGKTSLAMQIAEHVAIDHTWFEQVLDENGLPKVEQTPEGPRNVVTSHKGRPVAIFTLEMTTRALVKRMLFQRARADMQRWRTGFAKAEDYPPIAMAAGQLAAAPIYVDDAGRCTIDSVKAKARRMYREHGIGLFVIDYIQLMRTGSKRFRDDRVQELAEISGEIVNLTKELHVPFIVLAQMNRDYEKDPNRAPRLSDLKDCGSIEQDADLVGFLYAPKKAEDDAYKNAMLAEFGNDWSKYPSRVDLLWQKNRYGPCGPVQLLFQRSCTRFFDWNVWRKERGQLEPAQGEATLYKPQNRPPKAEEDPGYTKDPDMPL